MKLEINIDDSFVEAGLNLRSASFSKSLDLLIDRATRIRKTTSSRFPTYVLDNKIVGNNFAVNCGFKVPRVFQMGVSIDEIEFLEKTVIKPMYEHSGKGVFICKNKEKITYLNTNIHYKTVSSAKKFAKKLLQDKAVKKDIWMVEELLEDEAGLARDIKFYCFYGEIGLILETERVPQIKRCWYDSDLNYVDTGKYSQNSFKGDRAYLNELSDIAKKLSLEIPAPFVRIDFLICNGTYNIGEFTPTPGGYHMFNKEWDRKLGELFLYSTIELAHDVSIGKSFNTYITSEKTELDVISKFNK